MNKLAQYISTNGLSRRAFAASVGCSPSYMSEIMSGKKRPSLTLAVLIQRATNGDVRADAWIDEEAA